MIFVFFYFLRGKFYLKQLVFPEVFILAGGSESARMMTFKLCSHFAATESKMMFLKYVQTSKSGTGTFFRWKFWVAERVLIIDSEWEAWVIGINAPRWCLSALLHPAVASWWCCRTIEQLTLGWASLAFACLTIFRISPYFYLQWKCWRSLGSAIYSIVRFYVLSVNSSYLLFCRSYILWIRWTYHVPLVPSLPDLPWYGRKCALQFLTVV